MNEDEQIHLGTLCHGQNKGRKPRTWRRKLAPKERFYISPQELEDAVVEMKAVGYMTDRFARLLMTVQDKVLRFPRFVGYPDAIKEEISSYNMLKWVRSGWKTVDIGRGSIFAYLTTATHLNMLTGLKNYFSAMERHRKVKQAIAEQIQLELPSSATIDARNISEKSRIYEEVSEREREWLEQRGYLTEVSQRETEVSQSETDNFENEDETET